MAQGGAARHLGESGAMARLGTVPAVPSWLRAGSGVRGPLLTLAVTIVLDQLARRGLPVAQPFPALLLTVVYSGYSGGVRAGVLSAVLTVLYALHFLSYPGQILSYSPSAAVSLLLVGLAAPVLAFLGARLDRSRDSPVAAGLSRAEAEALTRRLSLLSAAGETLTTAPDLHAAFRDFARLTVPALADWSMIHLATGDGPLQYLAGAHRDPTRDLLVTALAEYGHARLPFGGPVKAAELAEVTDDGLQAVAEDEEQLGLYRALEPRGLMRLPLFSRGRVVGVVTLGVSRQWGRRLGTGELAFAQELVSRVGLAVDNARLRQETEDGRRRFQLLFEANPIPMWVFDAETLRFLAVNRAAVRHYGYSRSEFLSMTIMDIRPPDDTPGLNATLERGPHPVRSALTQHQGKDGRLLDMELISERLQFDGRRARLVLATDISDRTRTRAALQQTEDQLRQVQRLDTMGRLASGVAYDFNNLLTTIHGFSDLLLRDLPADDGRRADVEQIRRAADRGALLARQLTAFGGKPAMPPRALSLNEVVGDLDDLLQRLVGADVRLETRLAHGLPQVRMDQGQLEQIIVNLALNARDAMPAGGTLTLETAERQISASAGGHVRPGWYAVLGVSDTGAGVDEEALARTLEPSYGSPASGDGARSGWDSRSCTGSCAGPAGWSGCRASRGREPR